MNYTVIGLIAAALTTSSLLPQAIKTIKNKHTKDISLWTYLIYTIGILLWLVYGIIDKDRPLIFANSVTLSLSSIILFLKIKYK